ncbi:MAG TPA: VTT domain-containing protein [Bryobacteraceae bacterium]|nr:VTT domain-containing protein [Bryobacteraceae bacterium]
MRVVFLVCVVLAVILVPFFLWEEPMNRFADSILAHRGEWWIGPALAGLLAADVFLPVPSSIVSTAAGVMLGFLGGAVTNIAGMTLGCWLGYRTGRAAKSQGDPRLKALWERYGEWTLLVARAVPVLAEASVLFAGMTEMPMRRFLVLTTLANTGIGILYAAVGAFAMEWNSFLGAFFGSLAVPALAQAMMRVQWRK